MVILKRKYILQLTDVLIPASPCNFLMFLTYILIGRTATQNENSKRLCSLYLYDCAYEAEKNGWEFKVEHPLRDLRLFYLNIFVYRFTTIAALLVCEKARMHKFCFKNNLKILQISSKVISPSALSAYESISINNVCLRGGKLQRGKLLHNPEDDVIL